MKLQIYLGIYICSFLSASASLAQVPQQTFALNSLIIGHSTISDAQRIYGKATPYRTGKEDEADQEICYVSREKQPVFLVLETGPMGGYITITGARISIFDQKGHCVPTNLDISALSTTNGIRIGQSFSEFENALPIKFKRNGSSLMYEAVTQRQATKDELAELHANWPNEKQTYFDVTVNIQATFHNNGLADFYVSKIESY